MQRRYRAVVVTAVVLAVAVVATGVLAVVRTNQLRAARAEQERLAAQLADARERISELESEAPGEGLGLPEGLQLPQQLEDLLGEGGLGELFSPEQLDELLQGLLGETSSALGGAGVTDLLGCVGAAEQVSIDDGSGEAQFADIEAAVADLRELSFAEPVEPTYLDQQAISERVTDSVEQEYSEAVADVDERVLAAVGAIPPELDLRRTQQELLGEQVAGFYDSDTGEMVVGAADPDAVLNPTDQVTLAHELTHAITDQRLGLPELLDESEPDSDAALAALGLVEGDASLLMQRFAMAALSVQEQLQLATDPRAGEAQAALSSYPHVLQRELTFPYEQGLVFVCDIYGQGGWDAVDRAYDELPTSSAEVLFPERYGEPEPSAPRPPRGPGQGWAQLRTDTLGAATLQWLFEAPGDDRSAALTEPLARVRRWGADTLTVWGDGDETALGVAFRDAGGDGPTLCTSVTDWYDAAFDDDTRASTSAGERLAVQGGTQSAVVRCPGEEVRLGIAPDLATARTIAG